MQAALDRQSERTVCCLTGPSGIGKTGLARHVCAKLDPARHDGIVWVAAPRNRESGRVADTMLNVAEALGVRTRLPNPGDLEPEAFHLAFRTVFWGTVIVNCALLGWLLAAL